MSAKDFKIEKCENVEIDGLEFHGKNATELGFSLGEKAIGFESDRSSRR